MWQVALRSFACQMARKNELKGVLSLLIYTALRGQLIRLTRFETSFLIIGGLIHVNRVFARHFNG